jgi:hypothetical protein
MYYGLGRRSSVKKKQADQKEGNPEHMPDTNVFAFHTQS